MKNVEISWSLMHPTMLDVDYMKRVIEEAKSHKVDSFEICAACHSLLGGLDGLVLYEDFPSVAASLDREGIISNRENLRTILNMAHASGRPVYYWHREVTVWPEFLKAMPELLDERGEFDLLGAPFERLLRYKLTKAFEAVPELDGIVLTLTEADFSAIHNSTPDVYPPEKVVEKIVRIFAEEHKKLGKHFILRSFGSIAKDYEDILAGAELAAKDFSFEVETKITPYDFDSFLPDNPFMRPIPNLTMGAECDCLGEFLGAGYLPAENVENIVRYVRWGQKCGVDRFTIRLDRVGNNIFDAYPINLYAYEQAILNPELTAEDIRKSYWEQNYPEPCRKTLEELSIDGFNMITSVHYIDRQLIFHAFPPKAGLKWFKAGGIFGVFRNGDKMDKLSGIWSILADRNTPGRDFIIREKAHALALAEQGVAKVEALKPELPEAEYRRLSYLWGNAVIAGKTLYSLTKVFCAYFDDMEDMREGAPSMEAAAAEMEKTLLPLVKDNTVEAPKLAGFTNGIDHWANLGSGADLVPIYVKPLLELIPLIREEYQAEYSMRRKLAALPGVADFVVPGGIYDDGRCDRFMHASHSIISDGFVGRIVGNPIFPNGYIKYQLKGKANKLMLTGKGETCVTVNGKEYTVLLDENPVLDIVPAEEFEVTLRKVGHDFPFVTGIAAVGK